MPKPPQAMLLDEIICNLRLAYDDRLPTEHKLSLLSLAAIECERLKKDIRKEIRRLEDNQ